MVLGGICNIGEHERDGGALTMNGYNEAYKIDKSIARLFKKNPCNDTMTRAEAKEWWKLARTVTSSMTLIEKQALDVLNRPRTPMK